ncbi:MAG: NhaC family Na+:H+ antiporter [Paraglaciecola psychrophila]|jgi:NhaC family Na+:H+ antiporter
MSTPRAPSFLQAIVCFGGVIAIIACGLFFFAISLHSLMFLALLWSGLNAYYVGHNYQSIRAAMSDSVSRALPAIYIFILIGMVIASFMQSGTIATLIYYGLALLSPAYFLAAGLVLCALMSVATGTSWGTAGTMGLVLMGVGAAMGIPLPLVAGMVISGATFGDKLSPISDTTNLAAMSAGTDLYRHIQSMLMTTAPTFVLVFIVFLLIGQQYADGALAAGDLNAIQQALAGHYQLSALVTLLPLLVMILLSARRVEAEVAMSASIICAVVIALWYQNQQLSVVLNALWSNTAPSTGIENLDALLGRGGISSMSWTLILALMALALGGILQVAGFLPVLLSGFIARLKRATSLIAATMLCGLFGNMAMGEAYISIILNCQLFRHSFEKKGIDPAVLSRSVEEGSTLTTGLIPWTTAGAFYAATLGVPVLDYAPYALLNYLNPLVSIAMASLGLGLMKSAATTKAP